MIALAGVAQVVEVLSVHQEVAGSIPSVWEAINRCCSLISISHISLSLCLFLALALAIEF